MGKIKRILIVRTDRIGDVLLTIPMVNAIRAQRPKTEVSILVREYTEPLVNGQKGIEKVLTLDFKGRRKTVLELRNELKRYNFDAIIFAYPVFWIALSAFLAHISVRIGTGYRWYSFLFNYKHFEHRKYSVRHEAEYNLSLLKPLELSPNVPIISELEITDEEQEKASEMKKQMGIQNGDTFIILHPGSGGSARDWKPVRFAELAKKFLRTGCKVVITGSKDERTLIDFVAEKAGEGILSLKEDLNLKQLGAFIKKADLFISNSTGPLHIAAAVGVPVIGFYPPIQSCSPTRWGPLTEKKIIFQPDVNQCPRCKGGPCQGDDCMELITVSSVFEASKIFLNRYKGD